MANPLLLVLKGLHKTQSLILRSPVKERHTDNSQEQETQKPPDVDSGIQTESKSAGSNVDAPRRLRSLDSPAMTEETILFKFDLSVAPLDNAAPNRLSGKPSDLQLAVQNAKTFASKKVTAKSEKCSNPLNMKTFDYNAVDRPVDALGDDIFLPYHRRMERTEKRIQNIEKEQNALDLDYMSGLVKMLKDESTWKKHLCKVVLIMNADDDHELHTKRLLAIQELEAHLARYQKWKTKMNQQRHSLAKSKEREAEDKKKEAEAAKRAEAARQKEELRNKRRSLTLAKEEIKKRKREPLRSFHKLHSEEKYRVHPKFDQLIRREHRNAEPFGQPIPYLFRQDFSIPEQWIASLKPNSID